MFCEHCGSNGECVVCGGEEKPADSDESHDEARRVYAKTVAVVCAAVLLVIVVVAGICAVINQLNTR